MNENKKNDHLNYESKIYDFWIQNDLFNPKSDKKPYTIILPPPNVTGKLHLGHAWDVSLQDAIIRYHKMNGYDVLWVPGTDHAGIATQTKFEAILKQEQNETHFSLGREKFLEKLMIWKDDQANFIHKQWAKMGLSLSYKYEKFTMDADINNAVNTVFVELYKQGLIYRDKKLVNWDPILQTAISNIEVIYKNSQTKMYYFKYFNESKTKYLIVATSRPETMFGDVCLVINPNDTRYNWTKNEKFINPANDELLPVIFDEYIDIDFGTGVMKCTPAHDFNDNALAKKHNLKLINILNPDATMNEICGKYQGLDRFVCREKLVEEIKEKGLLEKIEINDSQLPYSERTGTIIEPFLSLQWFVKMKPLADKVIEMQNGSDPVIFYPQKYNDTLLTWLNNIEDWCISRQLWWGHQIPIWYNKNNNDIYCDLQPPKDIENWIRDDDVLDTWFSSGLWPFVTLNWPNETNLFKKYFPTDVLVTGYDIIFFWVSRMMMFSKYFTSNKPFKNVLIHGLIRDKFGKKMSKSLGNGIDPMDVIDQYGADTLRLFLTSTASLGEDLNYNDEKVLANWNFLNKLKNGSQYILNYIDQIDLNNLTINSNELNILDIWIIDKLNELISSVKRLFEKFNFVVATKKIIEFVWINFFNTYLEFTKFLVKDNNKNTIKILTIVLLNILKILHPQCPFITEEIYQSFFKNKSIMNEQYPELINLNIDSQNLILANQLINIINISQKYRSDMKLKNKDLIKFCLSTTDNINFDENKINLFNKFLNPLFFDIDN
ncbi:MAG: valine--tRNA ligase, partial [Ureaplasma sp.]|nr:valine--tRNA ligase [Ureaplasma sp.]